MTPLPVWCGYLFHGTLDLSWLDGCLRTFLGGFKSRCGHSFYTWLVHQVDWGGAVCSLCVLFKYGGCGPCCFEIYCLDLFLSIPIVDDVLL